MESSEDHPRTQEEILIEEALGGQSSAIRSEEKPEAAEVREGVTNTLTRDAVVHVDTPLAMMLRPEAAEGTPPGLEYLLELDELLIHQQVNLVEAFTCWDVNKYQITNNLGQQMYFAVEDSETPMRHCFSSQRAFVIHITDNFGQEVMRVSRKFKCCAGCCWYADSERFNYEIQVEAPVEQVCGYVGQLKSYWNPRYMIRDADGKDMFYMKGPPCSLTGLCNCFAPQEFKIFTPNQTEQVAVISKQWSNIVQELCTDADSFRTSFPLNLDIRMKATILATAFLIDFIHY